MVFMANTDNIMRDKVFSIQVIQKGTQKMIAFDVLMTREMQMNSNEKGLFEKLGKELHSALTKIEKNPNFKEMVLS